MHNWPLFWTARKVCARSLRPWKLVEPWTTKALPELVILPVCRLALLILAHETLQSQISSCESEQATQRKHLQVLEGRVYTFLEQYDNYVRA